ncbi:MAG: hypothetical protein GY804_09785 [Alphaproteobacteria bacterium]|nr:hypothetical protein [Alphaproteobacteria bacterium]
MSWVLNVMLDNAVVNSFHYASEQACIDKQVDIEGTVEAIDDYTFEILNKTLNVQELINDHVKRFLAPDEVILKTGTGQGVPTLADMITPFDGNVYRVREVSGVPGFDIDPVFRGVTSMKGIATRFFYEGADNHEATLDVYNYDTLNWDVFFQAKNAAGYDYRYIEFPNGDNYINDGAVTMRFYHSTTGSPSHYINIDFIAIVY